MSHQASLFHNHITIRYLTIQYLRCGSGSSNNKIFGNTIVNSITEAIFLNSDSSAYAFTSNKIVSSTPQGLTFIQDPTSKNNTFVDNAMLKDM